MKFFYQDGTTEWSSVQVRAQTSYASKTYVNPSQPKLVSKVEVWLRQTYGSSTYEAYEKNTVVWGPGPDSAKYLTLDLPQYKENNATHFRVKVEAERAGNDDVWFELIDESNATKTYANADLFKLIPFEAPIVKPKKLRIYLQRGTTSSLKPALNAVYWGTSDPKSLWTGTQRAMRDNHYAEGLEPLGTRNYSDPKNRYSTVGFRLVQRPD
jgi:hypothetical protein